MIQTVISIDKPMGTPGNRIQSLSMYIASIDGEKACDKIQHPFMILKKKTLNKAKYRANISQHNKSYIWHSHR